MSTLRLQADYESARAIGPWLQDNLDLASPLRERIGELELAIHEVAINVVDHAFGAEADGRDYTITLEQGPLEQGTHDDEASAEAAIVRLRDDGLVFEGAVAPNLDEPQIGGYGLLIAEQLSSSLSYERIGDINIWTLVFSASDTPKAQEANP